MIITSDTFIPTANHSTLGLVSIDGNEIRNALGSLVAVRDITDNKPGLWRQGATPLGGEFTSIKQTGGCGWGGGMDIDNWAREVSASGRVAILRGSHGEIWQ